MAEIRLREADKMDIPLILSLIRGLAEYEKLLHEVVATEEGLEKSLFGEPQTAFVTIAEWDENPLSRSRERDGGRVPDSAGPHRKSGTQARSDFQPLPQAGEAKYIPVGFALYFYNYSTFLGRRGIYIEDLYVLPEMRGKGIGKALLAHLADKAVKEGCGRLEWWVLDWNAPSIGFYKSLGAEPMEEWTVFRLTGNALQNLANREEIAEISVPD